MNERQLKYALELRLGLGLALPPPHSEFRTVSNLAATTGESPLRVTALLKQYEGTVFRRALIRSSEGRELWTAYDRPYTKEEVWAGGLRVLLGKSG